MTQLSILPRPCIGCPYRRDCPSGVWHRSEYEKLPEYDLDTSEQPPGVFLCHDADRQSTVCRGWLDCHDKGESLALRFAVAIGNIGPEVFDLPRGRVPVFGSGREAMLHGLKQIERPGRKALKLAAKLVRRHPELERDPDAAQFPRKARVKTKRKSVRVKSKQRKRPANKRA